MYITINKIIGEKTIDLSYPIQGKEALGPHSAEIAVITMLSDNAQYQLKGPMKVPLKTGEIINLTKGVYMDRELNVLMGMEVKLKFGSDEDVLKTNKLKGITEMTFSLEELDNSDNLEDSKHSNTLFTYHVSSPEYFTCFEPVTPQYKKLKNGEINSLALKRTDQNNKIITNGPGTTVVLPIHDCK